jgi:hypothetical protein
VKWIRRALLELWAILMLAGVVGFLGPFGTYLDGDFPSRVGRWWALLMGAYVLVRPIMIFWRWIAQATGLPRGSMTFWGVLLSSFPMALLWQGMGREEMRLLGGYSGILPFTLLCSLAVMAVAWWARRADEHLLRNYDAGGTNHWSGHPGATPKPEDQRPEPASPPLIALTNRPRLYARLSPGFGGDVLALESEDHYVRVHGPRQSELLLMRLRDAIAEMDGHPGEQTHRSWWVAREAVSESVGTGRNREIILVNGTRSPVARDSVDRLRQSGFLPA